MSVRTREPTTQPELDEPRTATDAVEIAAPTPAGHAVATSLHKRKEPPPEKPADVRRRTYVILSFWALILSLGLPIWWHTTSIHRANLPLAAMMDWAEGRACRPVFPLKVALESGSLQDQEAQTLLAETQQLLDRLPNPSGHHLRLEPAKAPLATASDSSTDDERLALTIHLTPGEFTGASLHQEQPLLDITYSRDSATSPSSLATFIAAQLRSIFAEERAVISNLLSDAAVYPDQQQRVYHEDDPPQVQANPDVAEAVAKRSTRSLKYAPTYHLTFSLFTAGPAPSSWDIDAAVERYMRPILDVLEPIHNFTIDTQVQLYAAPGVQSELLSKQDLSSFINAAEWPLSPSIGGAPTINFIVFVGNQTISLDSAHTKPGSGSAQASVPTSQSWLIPQWGTVYLLAHTAEATTHVASDTLRAPMQTFAAHLLSLLGTPQSGSLPLRLSSLSRVRSADLVLRASSTLGSLARLSLALPSIAIPQSVADGVSTTMLHLRSACDSLGTSAGLVHARVAEAAAEHAFFEKSMVGQLYFPDEHKVAVYLPLLGPVGVPLIMSLLNEIKAWKKRRRDKMAASPEKE